MRKRVKVFPVKKTPLSVEGKLNLFLEELAEKGVSPDRIRIHAAESYVLVEWTEQKDREPVKIAVAEKVKEVEDED